MKRRSTYRYATADIRGGDEYPDLRGTATFVQTVRGVMVTVKVSRLPPETPCNGGIFALHIHEGDRCSASGNDPFGNTGAHDNPAGCPHPYHAGDLPPLFGNDGYAYMVVLTNRFTVDEIVHRTIVIHAGRDDFSTQPSGGSGVKIGCGEIVGRR